MNPVMRSVLAVAAAAGVLTLSGCSGNPNVGNPNVAATVNGTAISVSQVEATAAGVADAQKAAGKATALRGAVASLLVRSQVMLQAGQAKGVTISDADVKTAMATSTEITSYANDPRSAQFAQEYVRAVLVAQKLGSAPVIAFSQAADVELNPRYGVWDPATLDVSNTSGSLSSLADATK